MRIGDSVVDMKLEGFVGVELLMLTVAATDDEDSDVAG